MWTASDTTACRTTGTGPSGSDTPVWHTKPISSLNVELQRDNPTGAVSMLAAVSRSRLIQMAEQLEGPEEVVRTTYSNSTWQNRSFEHARSVARGDRGQLTEWGLSLGLFGVSGRGNDERRRHPEGGRPIHREPRSRTLGVQFGSSIRRSGQPAISEGDRNRWYMLQPYLIALLMSKGIPMRGRVRTGRKLFLPSRLRRPRFTASAASLGMCLMMAPGALDHLAC